MNVFFLDTDPRLAAQAHVDRHVVKMILETAQLLSTAHHVLDPDYAPEGIYKSTHVNHPSAKWVRETGDNYWWTYKLFRELCVEYTYRYGRQHASERLLPVLDQVPEPLWFTGELYTDMSGPMTPPVPAMLDEYKLHPNPATLDEAVVNYRNYYKHGKASLHTWTRRNPPEWI